MDKKFKHRLNHSKMPVIPIILINLKEVLTYEYKKT